MTAGDFRRASINLCITSSLKNNQPDLYRGGCVKLNWPVCTENNFNFCTLFDKIPTHVVKNYIVE